MNTLGRILSLWFVLALLAPSVQAQDLSEAASLPEGIAATGDTTEVRALTAWAREHQNSQPQQAERVAQRALTLARSLGDQQGVASSAMLLGNLVLSTDSKEAYYTEAAHAYESLDHEHGLIRARLNLGMVYRRRGDLERAFTYYFDALAGLERFGDVHGQAVVMNNIGIIHAEEGNSEEALVYYERAVELAETLDNPRFYASMLHNLGGHLAHAGAYERAITILSQALAIADVEGNEYQTALIFYNLGFAYNEQDRYEQALTYLLTAESLTKELQEDYQLLMAVYYELGKTHLGLRQFDRAHYYTNESLTLAREGSNLSLQMEAHYILSRIHRATGDYERALVNHEEYVTIRDSIVTAEKTEIIAHMQTRYETEEKQRAIERLEQESRIQVLQTSRWRMGMLGGVGTLLLLLGFLYYRYRIKQKANRLLEELDAAKSRFFANISHEFRTPLTVILGGSQDMLAGHFGQLSDKASRQLHAMLRNTRQLQRLINEVLDLNRLESGHLELQPAPGDLVRFLTHMVEASAPLADRNGITLTLACDAQSCPRLYDEEKLEKIVGNLLSNALKFTLRDGSVRVDLRCKDQIEISVTDDGPGIPHQEQSKVFERFAQLDHGMLKGGTGIGLALAKELAELHGGTITLESEPDTGSTFTVRLPLERTSLLVVQERKSGNSLEIENVITGSGDGHVMPPLSPWEKEAEDVRDRTTVLIIEDNDDVRAYVRRSLEETYRILEVVDAESGLQRARTELPDLIVSDVMLPGIDGYDFVRRLKAEPAIECIPVVMLTARAAESDHVTGYDSGAEVYITKPFSSETLRAACARLLAERQRLRRRLQEEISPTNKGDQQNGHSTLRDRARLALLEHHYDEEFSVEELATALHVSRHTLYRHIKQETGLSPTDLIRTLRLERAHELLSTGAGSVSEVAYAVGFRSRSHFTRSFREHYGIPPLSVRDATAG